MATNSTDEAKKRYESLPPEIKNLIYSPEMSFTVQQIGQKNRLHIDQIDSLNTEIGQVMLGFAKTEEFVPILIEMLNVERSQAEAIAKDVNDMLFLKIRDSMKKVAGEGGLPPTFSAPTVVAPATAPTATLPPKSEPPQSASAPKLVAAHSADLMLTQKTASVAPAAPKPQNYKTDPYHEPIE